MQTLYLIFCFATLVTASIGKIEAGQSPSDRKAISDLEDHIHKYCNVFLQIPFGSIGSTMKEMEVTQFSLDMYFETPVCQSERYSENVKSPLMHIVVDNPNARERFPEMIFKYFKLIKNEPDRFTAAVNARNTKGETLLDYIETLKNSQGTNLPEQIEVYNKFIDLICKSGGIYSRYRKSCDK